MAFGSPTGLVPSTGVIETDNMLNRETEAIGFEEKGNVETQNLQKQGLVSYLEGRFTRNKNARRTDEQRWLSNYRNFRGQYGPEVQFTSTEKSKIFIKITKTKVMAAYNKIVDVLFASNKFPIGVENTPMPDGVADKVSVDEADQQMGQGQPVTSPVAARADILALLGPTKKVLEPVKDKVKEGAGVTPTSYTWEPAKIAARNMEKKITDQLAEADADKALRKFIFEICLFGSGAMKGPLLKEKEYPRWEKDENGKGKYNPIIKPVPEVNDVSIWDIYPDPERRFVDEDTEMFQRHKMNKIAMRKLKKRPHFRSKSIEAAIERGPNYHKEYWETDIEDYRLETSNESYEVLEYWGFIDKKDADEAGLTDIPREYKKDDQVQVNVWMCNGQILRIVYNTFTPCRTPYYVVPYELNPYSMFGIGVAENMEDTQLWMNGVLRQMIDNGVLSSNVMLEVDETNLVAGQDFEMYPGKIFRRQGGQPGQSIHAISIPSTTQDTMAQFDKARQLADEATGIPSYSHGQGGVQGVGRTAAGMSMLMGAAAENIKGVVRNIDDYLLIPLGKALFAFNMQFDFDEQYVGDLEIVARGTESLMRNEIRSQKILQFMQMANNPMDAPWVKRDYLLRELAQALDLDPELVVNDPRAAGVQAMMIKEMQLAQGIDPNGGGGPPGAGTSSPSGGAPPPSDPTGNGGGNIAPGAERQPGMAGSTDPTKPAGAPPQ